jgi:hypothetical protein
MFVRYSLLVVHKNRGALFQYHLGPGGRILQLLVESATSVESTGRLNETAAIGDRRTQADFPLLIRLPSEFPTILPK